MSEVETVEMARRKNSKKPEGAASRRLSVQASEEWILWVEEGAEHLGTDVSKLTDAAIRKYLKAEGFDKPPPKRVP